MKAVRVRMPQIITKRSKLFVLTGLFVVGSALSILSLLVQPKYASAITAAQKDYCVANYPSGKSVANAVETDAAYKANKCDEICTTKMSTQGLVTSTGCDPNKVASEGTTTTPDTATNNILKAGYSDVAVNTLCGSDQACASKTKTAVEQCVDAFIANGYDSSDSPVYPDVNTDSLANCMSGKGYTAAQVNTLKSAYGEARSKITQDAQNSSNATSKATCEAQQGYTWNEDTNQCDAPKDNKTTCAVEGVGWLICPAMNLMAKLNDTAYTFLASHFLVVDTELVAGVKDAWAKFRDVANVMFVIAFLAVVYSQLTSVGISNYGIKKMLPKIVVAAILVNMSYIICQVAVDISNIIGYGIASFFKDLAIGNPTTNGSDNFSALGNTLTWAAAIGGILAAGVGIALGVSFPVLLAALLAIGLIVLILIARQALIVLLIAIAPVAFVAYLLPNTEQWFKKWTKMFSSLLLLFPTIALVFGASRLAGIIIFNAHPDDSLMRIVALGVSALPFFVVPGLLKGALNAAGSIGAKLQGMADARTKRTAAGLKKTSGERWGRTGVARGFASGKQARTVARNAKYARKVNSGKGITARTANVGAYAGGGSAGTTALRRNALTAASDEEQKDIKAAELEMDKQSEFTALDANGNVVGKQALTNSNRVDMARSEFIQAMRSGDATKARAAQNILMSTGNKGLETLQESYATLGNDQNYSQTMQGEAGQKALSDMSSAGLKGKNSVLDSFARADMGGGGQPATQIGQTASSAGTYNLNASQFAGQSEGNLKAAYSAGVLDQNMAKSIQQTESYSSLDAGKMKVIDNIANGNTPTGTPTNT